MSRLRLPNPRILGPSLRTGAICAAITIASAVLAAPASAQTTGDGFFFKPSHGHVTLFGGFAQANANSRIFDFTTEQLTLSKGDFSAITGGLEVSARVASHLDLTLGVGHSQSTNRSEFRDWVDQDDLPIEQTTTFSRTPITAGVKAYLLPQGRSIGRLAWIPSRFAPYVGGAAGVIFYNFKQDGDFIDYTDFSVFPDSFQGKGHTGVAQLMAGVDISLGTRFGIASELKKQWARGELGDSFVGFDRIDLSGVTATAGLFVRF